MGTVRRADAAAAILIVLGVYQCALGCSQNCYPATATCMTDASGDCLGQKCWQYDPFGTSSCWICGTGSPGNGWCIIGDANLTCIKVGKIINYKTYQSCTSSCQSPKKPNAYTEAGSFGDVMPGVSTEQQYICTVK